MFQRVRVLIVGGGIAGCSLWLALRQHTERALARGRGTLFSATVFEQARQIQPVGAGIALGPNGLRVLDGLGLLDRLKVLGGDMSRLHVYTDQGQLLRTLDCSYMMQRHGYPMLCMERAELQALLVHQVLRADTLQPVPGQDARAMRFGKRCVMVRDVGPSGGGMIARFEDGTEVAGDLVVGADGANSAVRSALLQPQGDASRDKATAPGADAGKPKYAGISCLLGVTSSVPESIQGNAYWVMGKGRFYGTWSMGRHKQYWFLTRREELLAPGSGGVGDRTGAPAASSSSSSSDALEEGRWTPADALHGMDEMWNWYHPYDAHAMFSRTVRAVKVGFFELPQGQQPPLAGLGGSRVAILGDSAHAMLPTVHQGANLAIEDAAVLAQTLAKRCSPVGHAASSLQGGASASSGAPDLAARGSEGGSEVLEEGIRAALREYASLRESRVHRVAGMARRTGVWQTSESLSVEFVRSTAIRWLPSSILQSSLDWIYNYRPPADGFSGRP